MGRCMSSVFIVIPSVREPSGVAPWTGWPSGLRPSVGWPGALPNAQVPTPNDSLEPFDMELVLETSCEPCVVGHSMILGVVPHREDGNSPACVFHGGGVPPREGVTLLPIKVILSFVFFSFYIDDLRQYLFISFAIKFFSGTDPFVKLHNDFFVHNF